MVLSRHLRNEYGSMTVISWYKGAPVFRDGKVGADAACCCDVQPDPPPGIDCTCEDLPAATITIDLSVGIPEPDATEAANLPSGALAVPAGTYTGQIVFEWGTGQDPCFYSASVDMEPLDSGSPVMEMDASLIFVDSGVFLTIYVAFVNYGYRIVSPYANGGYLSDTIEPSEPYFLGNSITPTQQPCEWEAVDAQYTYLPDSYDIDTHVTVTIT